MTNDRQCGDIGDGADTARASSSVDTARVAVGLDYESEQPWVHVIRDEPWHRAEDFESPWLIREVPAELAQRFTEANRLVDQLVKDIHAAAGYDPAHSRLFEWCDEWQGEPYHARNGHTFYDDCARCGWSHEAHNGGGE